MKRKTLKISVQIILTLLSFIGFALTFTKNAPIVNMIGVIFMCGFAGLFLLLNYITEK
jgi:hypothetical protein